MRIKSMVLVLLSSVFLCVCSAYCLTLTEKDNGSTVNVSVGQYLEIILASNISTGYSWNVVSIDPALLSQEGEGKYKREVERIGGGGHTTFRFKAIEKGEASLTLAYYRIWEKSQPYEKTFTVTVSIN